jgi:hypothetical protein
MNKERLAEIEKDLNYAEKEGKDRYYRYNAIRTHKTISDLLAELTQKDAEIKAERSMVSTLNIKIDNQKEEIKRRLNQIKELKGK